MLQKIKQKTTTTKTEVVNSIQAMGPGLDLCQSVITPGSSKCVNFIDFSFLLYKSYFGLKVTLVLLFFLF